MLYQGPQEGKGQEPEPRPDCLGPAPSATPKGKGTAEPRQGRGHLQDSASRLGVAEGGGQRALHLEEAAHPTSSSCFPEARAAGSSSSGVPAGEALTAALTQTFSPHSARPSRSPVSTFASPGPPGPEKEEEPLLPRAQSGLVREQDTRSPSSAPKAHSQVQAPSWTPTRPPIICSEETNIHGRASHGDPPWAQGILGPWETAAEPGSVTCSTNTPRGQIG